MNFESVFGNSAIVTGMILAFIGLPAQIIKNWRLKSGKGLSLPFWLLNLVNSSLWMLYGLAQRPVDWRVAVANIPVALFSLTTGDLISMPRFVVPMFPGFIALAQMGERAWLDKVILIAFLMLQGVLALMFTKGYWIA